MPDIAMCKNNKCPSRKLCYRFDATPNAHRQSYGSFGPEGDEQACDSFIVIEEAHSSNG
jgi:hypothetical protein